MDGGESPDPAESNSDGEQDEVDEEDDEFLPSSEIKSEKELLPFSNFTITEVLPPADIYRTSEEMELVNAEQDNAQMDEGISPQLIQPKITSRYDNNNSSCHFEPATVFNSLLPGDEATQTRVSRRWRGKEAVE